MTVFRCFMSFQYRRNTMKVIFLWISVFAVNLSFFNGFSIMSMFIKIDNCECFSSENCYFDTNSVEKTFKTPTKPFTGVFGLKNRDFLRRPPCSTLPHIYASRPVQNGKTNLQSAFLELYSFHFSLIVMGNN